MEAEDTQPGEPRRTTSSLPQASISISQLELGAPIATLRSLGALRDSRTSHAGNIESETNTGPSFDPITLGILTEQEAIRAFNMYVFPSHLRLALLTDDCWAAATLHTVTLGRQCLVRMLEIHHVT